MLRTAAAAAAKSLQSWPTLCHPIDGSPPDSPVPGILQAYWSGLPFPSPGTLSDPGIEPGSLTLQADSLNCYKSIRKIHIHTQPNRQVGLDSHLKNGYIQ